MILSQGAFKDFSSTNKIGTTFKKYTKPTTRSNKSKQSRAKHDLIDFIQAPVRDKVWVQWAIRVIENCTDLRTFFKAPRDFWKDDFITETNGYDENLFAFQTLIGLVLSIMTKDENVVSAMNELKRKGLMSIEKLADASYKEIFECVRGVLFNEQKATSIIKIAQQIRDEFDSKVPHDFVQLQTLHGVGEKIAALTLLEGFNDDSYALYGIDHHMYNIFRSYFKFVNPDDTEIPQLAETLGEWLPRKYWKDLNRIFSGLGQIFSRRNKNNWKEIFDEAKQIGGADFEEEIKILSILYMKEADKVNELRRIEFQKNPPRYEDIADQMTAPLWDDLLLLGWSSSGTDFSVMYRPGFNEDNKGTYNKDWFNIMDNVRAYLRGLNPNKQRCRANSKSCMVKKKSTRKSNRLNGKSAITVNDSLTEDKAREIAKNNFDTYFDFQYPELDISKEGDSVGWYRCKERTKTIHYPVIRLKNDSGWQEEDSITIAYYGLNFTHATHTEGINLSNWKSFEECDYFENERRLTTFLKRIQNQSVFKNNPLELQIEAFYVRELWHTFHPNNHALPPANDEWNEEPAMSEYEILRMERMKRNQQRLYDLGLRFTSPDNVRNTTQTAPDAPDAPDGDNSTDAHNIVTDIDNNSVVEIEENRIDVYTVDIVSENEYDSSQHQQHKKEQGNIEGLEEESSMYEIEEDFPEGGSNNDDTVEDAPSSSEEDDKLDDDDDDDNNAPNTVSDLFEFIIKKAIESVSSINSHVTTTMSDFVPNVYGMTKSYINGRYLRRSARLMRAIAVSQNQLPFSSI